MWKICINGCDNSKIVLCEIKLKEPLGRPTKSDAMIEHIEEMALEDHWLSVEDIPAELAHPLDQCIL